LCSQARRDVAAGRFEGRLGTCAPFAAGRPPARQLLTGNTPRALAAHGVQNRIERQRHVLLGCLVFLAQALGALDFLREDAVTCFTTTGAHRCSGLLTGARARLRKGGGDPMII